KNPGPNWRMCCLPSRCLSKNCCPGCVPTGINHSPAEAMDTTLEKIYESSNSTVYKKTDPGGTAITIKVLKPDLNNPKQILQFNNEFAILSGLNISGVKQVLSKGYFEGSPSIIARYFDGQNVREYIHEHPFDLISRLRIAVQVAHILGQVHAGNIIHRDITAENIL